MTQNAPEGCVVSVVQDEEAVRNALGNLLESVGLSVQTFSSAEQYVDSARSSERSCLILDIHLPLRNGRELERRLSDGENPVPIIFITAHTDDTLRGKALRAGAVGFFRKPFNSEALLQAVHSALR
jgi:FixJ family two-component response regulator